MQVNPDCVFKCCPICWERCFDGQCSSAGCLGNDPGTEMSWSMCVSWYLVFVMFSDFFRKIICDFGDHTGQLKRLPLYGKVAEDALGLPCTGPLTLRENDCELLKRQKLWKRYRLRVQVSRPGPLPGPLAHKTIPRLRRRRVDTLASRSSSVAHSSLMRAQTTNSRRTLNKKILFPCAVARTSTRGHTERVTRGPP